MSSSYQPPSRTRFYRDKRHGKIMGICAGIADYTGFDVSLVRITMVAAILLSSGSIVPIYFLAGMIAPDKPSELENTDVEEREFWRQVRRSPTRTARDIRLRLKDIDRRLADVESYVTTENRSLAREIEQLRLQETTAVNVSDLIDLVPWIALITAVSIGGWVLSTWLRIKHGYPLENSWGMAVHPSNSRENSERIKLLTNENAQLRAEIGSLKDRLETVERIVTDKPSKLAREIDALAIGQGGNA